MTSSARPNGIQGRPTLGSGINNRFRPGPKNATSSNTTPSLEQPRIPTRTVVAPKENTIKTPPEGAVKGNSQDRKASSLVPREANCPPEKGSRGGLAKPSTRPVDRSKAFAALQIATATPSHSQFAWVPLHMDHHTDRHNSAGGSLVDPHLWRRGPADPSGVVLDLSDRPLLCMSVRGTEAAIGCSDHSVYVVDVSAQKLQRNLYGKQYGHVDWVTCVDFVEDGRIISGGMDNKLCLWDATGVRCTDLQGHTASISGVKVIDSKYALSASYDKTLLLWDLNGSKKSKPVGCLQGHRGAVLSFAVNSEGGIVSGSRDGEVFLWDGRDGKPVLRCKGAHDGHVTAVECLTVVAADDGRVNDSLMLFVTGGQDGVLQVWDKRTKAPVQTVPLSRSPKGKGAITDIAITTLNRGGAPMVVTASADKVIRVLEPRSAFQVLHVVGDHTDFIYSVYTCGSLMWSGGGNGNLLVHDLSSGSCLYGLGATRNGAPRCISLAGPRSLVVAGDDGNCMMYSL
ncbi:unnamed protein product [Calypogeia fissa]